MKKMRATALKLEMHMTDKQSGKKMGIGILPKLLISLWGGSMIPLVVVQGRLLKPLFSNTDMTKATDTLGINNIKSQLFIRETKQGSSH